MIKANELRIGNWVIVDKQGIKSNERIQSISSYTGKFNTFEDPHYDRIETLEPIPLTEEWVVKFGFAKIIAWDDFTFYRKNGITIEANKDGINIEANKNGIGIEVNNDGYYANRKITDVHQLQNFYFALTGKELEIKGGNNE